VCLVCRQSSAGNTRSFHVPGAQDEKGAMVSTLADSPVIDTAPPVLFFHFGLDFTAGLLSEEVELKHEAVLSCSP